MSRLTLLLKGLANLLPFGPPYRLDHRPVFPPPERTTEEGLLAYGGDLSVPRLLEAYRQGIFPWYDEDDPILWWSPDPRLILEPCELRISRSLRATIRKGIYRVSVDTAFSQVIRSCAKTPRRDQPGTWIVPEVETAYTQLYDLGYAHSVETWSEEELVGGLYGVCLGGCFFGESMFSTRTDASKVALAALVDLLKPRGIGLIDCQVPSEHLISLGAQEIPRSEFLQRLRQALQTPTVPGRWPGALDQGEGSPGP